MLGSLSKTHTHSQGRLEVSLCLHSIYTSHLCFVNKYLGRVQVHSSAGFLVLMFMFIYNDYLLSNLYQIEMISCNLLLLLLICDKSNLVLVSYCFKIKGQINYNFYTALPNINFTNFSFFIWKPIRY